MTEWTYKKYARQHDSCFEKSMGFGNLGWILPLSIAFIRDSQDSQDSQDSLEIYKREES